MMQVCNMHVIAQSSNWELGILNEDFIVCSMTSSMMCRYHFTEAVAKYQTLTVHVSRAQSWVGIETDRINVVLVS